MSVNILNFESLKSFETPRMNSIQFCLLFHFYAVGNFTLVDIHLESSSKEYMV